MALFERFRKSRVLEAGKALVKKGGSKSFVMTGEDDHNNRESKFKIYNEAYNRVPLITAIIDVQSDQAVQEFFFEGPSSDKLDKWADKVNLMQFFHRMAKSMVLYGNGYVEVIKKGDEIEQLKLLDPIYMNVYRKPTGDITGYSQIIGDKKLVLWGSTGSKLENLKYKKRVGSIDSISHFKHNVLGSEKYGLSIVKPLVDSINIKLDMESNLKKVVFKYVAPLIWAKVGNDSFPANSAVVDSISNTLRDLSAESEITTSHLVELSVLDFNAKGMDIKTPIDHVEQQIITGGQVPPVLLGRAGAGKADSEVQLRSFGRHVKALQRELKNEFEDKILVGQGMGTEEDKLVWSQAEEREREIEIDMLRGLVTDGILTPQKANDLLSPKFRETLPTPEEKAELLNGQQQDSSGIQKPRPTQRKDKKVKGNKNDPTQTTKDKKSFGKRINKTDREVPIK
ncbi:hypothetical protein CMI37_31095 [Candidatus Pacearchaeota archaeon]|nr:hypothetical protein [Candidatus Pacearchaeota archaeon]|tara:strand:+ start:1859 stop:3220 length:1362 start_codon:yes stop_codon:yes gene_type:complete